METVSFYHIRVRPYFRLSIQMFFFLSSSSLLLLASPSPRISIASHRIALHCVRFLVYHFFSPSLLPLHLPFPLRFPIFGLPFLFMVDFYSISLCVVEGLISQIFVYVILLISKEKFLYFSIALSFPLCMSSICYNIELNISSMRPFVHQLMSKKYQF